MEGVVGQRRNELTMPYWMALATDIARTVCRLLTLALIVVTFWIFWPSREFWMTVAVGF